MSATFNAGRGGGGAYGRRSLTDKKFESMLPGFADHLTWDNFGMEPDLIAGAALPTAQQLATARQSLITELAKDKVRKALGGQTTVTAGVPKPTKGIPQVVVNAGNKQRVKKAVAASVKARTTAQGGSRGSNSNTGGYRGPSYQGGTYGGFGGANINQGVGQAFKNR